ncbi:MULTISPECIES: lactoferrin/transferrin family TonB-dependent receptor [unclassified Moraxella]|uniref:lactoferrin/transferrin family TonB-dependent receptor n=1 Tax=unclassified Moraxella TaxID=2685852 RepID=UPI002B414258|nr:MULTISPECIES: lactoferrin/transferrin family TonB-dependent receptor [unclassified Moraxella]
MHQYKYNLLFSAVSLALFGNSAWAQEQNTNNISSANNANIEPVVVLENIDIVSQKKATRKTNEITGLGKVVKRTTDIDKDLVLGIRDLTRYDPGISVVEQGRGATSGYAIRGVDKNRVAIMVDGLNQAQSYVALKTQAGGGAINEVEYENIKNIELSKGASSAEYGSGALGGAVGFVTKDAFDVIKQGKNWGLDSKSAYSSKNDQWTQSIAGAFQADKFDSILIYTHREGKQTLSHSDIDAKQHSYQPLVGYFNRYDLISSQPNTYSNAYYLVKNDCPTLDCLPLPSAEVNRSTLSVRTTPILTDEEQAQADRTLYPTKTASTKEYTGRDRVHANPMDYKSKSIFYKAGYSIDDAHRLWTVIEHTKQYYNIQDMTLPAYYTKDSHGVKSLTLGGNLGIPDDINNPLSGLVFDAGNTGKYGARYSNTRFFDEVHQKNRFGLSYQFTNPNQQGLLDKATVSLDNQVVNLDSTVHLMRCNDYPNLGRCQASLDKPWSWSGKEHNKYQERITLAQTKLEKRFEIAKSKHHVGALIGVSDLKSVLDRGALSFNYVSGGYKTLYKGAKHAATGITPWVYERLPVAMQSGTACNANSADNNSCQARVITGKNAFWALKDHIQIGDKVDLGLGLRHDTYQFRSDDEWTAVGNYKNWSYNAGLTVRPTDYLALSYRYSNGFRVPAFYEMYGIRTGASGKDNALTDKDYKSRVAPRPEKSTNHEFGVGVSGRLGTLEASYFTNKYKDLIAKGDKKDGVLISDYYNIQNLLLEGVNVLGKIDWYGVSDRLPDGLYSNIAYNHIKVKDRHIYKGFTLTTDPILDAIQPARMVVGVGYDAPDGQWGFNHSLTYSMAKNADELTGSAYYGSNIALAIPNKGSRSWYTHDLIGYFMPHKNITVRAGIHNLMNYKYSTWESLRQSSINAVNQDTGTNHVRYAAPGRNYTVSLEMKF